LGSEAYVQHPVVPLESTVADLNLDGLNILGTVRDMIPLGSDRSTIGRWVEKVAKAQKLILSPEPRPEQGSFFRSDHFPFAKAGVPAVNIETGDNYVGRPANWGNEQFRLFNEKHYHQPSDEYHDSWDMRGAVQEEVFIIELAKALANSPDRPHNALGGSSKRL
jgi:Zn-dependent M28 family amino/carboxypeptidase